jgi:hypothetical protein
MAFVEAPTLPVSILWWVWKSRPGETLQGYFLGLIERQSENGNSKEKALVVYDEAKNVAWVAYLRGILWRTKWEDLLYHKVLISYDGEKFQVKYDPEDTIEETPALSFEGKFQGFAFTLPNLSQSNQQLSQESQEQEIDEKKIPF